MATAITGATWPAIVGRVGPWEDAGGNLWVIALNASNQATAYKSTNGGSSWSAISSYTTTAISGGSLDAEPDSPTAATVIYVLGQSSTHTLVVLTFTIGSTAWARFDSGTAPTVLADVNTQYPAFLLRRANGSVAVAYQGPLHATSYRSVYCAATSTAGAWGSGTGFMAATEVDISTGNYHQSLKSVCRGASDRMHILFVYARTSHGFAHRSLSSANALDTASEPYAATLAETGRYSIAYVNARLEISGPTSGTTYRPPIHSAQDSQANNTWANDVNAVGNEVVASCATVFAYDATSGLLFAFFRDSATADVFVNTLANYPAATTWTAGGVAQSVATAPTGISTSGTPLTPTGSGAIIAAVYNDSGVQYTAYAFPINLTAATGVATAGGGTATGASTLAASGGAAAASGPAVTATWQSWLDVGIAIAGGGTATYSAVAGGLNLTAATGLATAGGGAATYLATVSLTAATGTASAAGGTATPATTVAATTGTATAAGGTVSRGATTLTAATGGLATAAGGTATYTATSGALNLTAATGVASATGGTVSRGTTTLTAATGTASATGSITAPTLTLAAATGTAAATGGIVSRAATTLTASTGTATAAGGAASSGQGPLLASGGTAVASGGTVGDTTTFTTAAVGTAVADGGEATFSASGAALNLSAVGGGGGIPTALTAYLTNTAATTLALSQQLSTSPPAAGVTVNATNNMPQASTGFTELVAQGTTATTGAYSGSAPAPSGKGFLLDDTSLEGAQLAAGTWAPAIRLGAGSGGPTATFHVRIWIYHAGGTYTQLTASGTPTDLPSNSQAFVNTSLQTLSFAGASFDAVTLVAGDKLYVDLIAEVTVGFTSSTANARRFRVEENGGAGDALVSPGYSIGAAAATAAGGIANYSQAATLIASAGLATAAGGTVTYVGTGANVNLTAATGVATATGPAVTATFSTVVRLGAATAGGGSATYTSGAVGLNLTATGGTATASGVEPDVLIEASFAAGTATTTGGTATYTSISGAVLTATLGTATATGGIANRGPTTVTAVTGTSTATGGTAVAAKTYPATGGAATAAGGTVARGPTALTAATGTSTAAGGVATYFQAVTAIRALGAIIVTTQPVLRPHGLAHVRTLGAPAIIGRHISPAGLARTRALGTPTLSGRIQPAGLAHARALGAPRVKVLTPASLTHARALGASPTITLVIKRIQPAALTHTRTLGTPTARGHLTASPTSLTHTRALGTPTLSGRTLPASLVHTRGISEPRVHRDDHTLAPAGLARA